MRRLLNSLKAFLRSGKGSISTEFAVFLPLVLLLAWVFWNLGDAYRMQAALNRQTALLADMVANQAEEYTLEGSTTPVSIPLLAQLPTLVNTANDLLKDALGKDNRDITTGITVEYLPTFTVGQEPVVSTFSAGRQCPALPGTQALMSLSGAGGGSLTPSTETGMGAMRLLRVRACVNRNNAQEFFELVAPKQFLSQFIVTRKEN